VNTGDIYRELSRRLMMENSELIPSIWRAVCDEREARLVAALPGTAAELSERMGIGSEEIREMLAGLFQKGAVFESARDGETLYRMPEHARSAANASRYVRCTPSSWAMRRPGSERPV